MAKSPRTIKKISFRYKDQVGKAHEDEFIIINASREDICTVMDIITDEAEEAGLILGDSFTTINIKEIPEKSKVWKKVGEDWTRIRNKGGVDVTKTRVAYGYHRESGKLLDLGDTVDQALKANMMVRDYEKALVAANPQLEITFKVEKK